LVALPNHRHHRFFYYGELTWFYLPVFPSSVAYVEAVFDIDVCDERLRAQLSFRPFLFVCLEAHAFYPVWAEAVRLGFSMCTWR
jgi:hypothetical protein